VPRSFFVACFK